MQPNLGIPEQLLQSQSHLQAPNAFEGSRLSGRLGSSAQAPLQLHDDYGDEGQFEKKPKIVKDFAKAYMQVRFIIYRPGI